MFRGPPARGRPRHPALDIRPDEAKHGRGAVGNPTGRFERDERVETFDGWADGRAADPEDALPPVETVVGVDATRSIICRNDSPDVGFDRSINPYRGCEHGCIYCFARPTHAYLGLSPGLDFETKLFHKPDAAILLRRELSRKSYKPAPIALGVNTDAYQPVERRLRTTRGVLEVLSEFRHPVGLITKSVLILRDLDILAPMAALNLCRVTLSITTLDRDLARVMEPRASTPSRRLDAIRGLARAGVPVQINVAPIIPGLNDHEIEALIEAGARAGATSAGWTMLRLPLELATLFEDWLRAHRPDRAARILSLIRQIRGGRLNDPTFGGRMRGEGPLAELVAARVRAAKKRFGMAGETDAWGRLDSSLFRVPSAQGDLFAS
jgi:DNA repair photolyase